MSKPLLVVLVAVTGLALWTDGAEARWRRGYSNQSNVWYSNSSCSTYTSGTVMAPTTMAVTSEPGTPVAQSNTTSSYQSYSYEPSQYNGSAPVNTATGSVVMARAPGTSRTNAYEYNNVLRGDRKVRGHTAQAE